ncbi:hypothetical protein DFR24_4398 [Panacagrimonas perspica]|uniref:O-antigen ligase-like membrane protein n=2 Tax=Panacagrimonas perspica TaxID=381431 RepID=A0A4R7NSU6_9GAMM|nr:hypothetical protein DFR24_4398 [Panacagrimonas perspica]THD04552.1 hypothetical protein B1810_03785 [Panacagrimonas perspica]
MLFIWACYLLRLSHDYFVDGIEGADYSMQYFIAGSVLPALALWKSDTFDQSRYAWAGFMTCSLGCAMSLVGDWLGAFGYSELTSTTGRLSTESLNPISLGHLAASGILCGAVLCEASTRRLRALLVFVMAGLLLVLLQTGSKGPAVALIFALAIWAVRRGHLIKILLVSVPIALLLSTFNELPLLSRISGAEEDLSTLERVVLLNDSLQQIVASPWVGSSSVELKSGHYPHNVFVEAAMALGIPLASMFVLIVSRGAMVGWHLIGTRSNLLGMLFVQSLIISVTSGSLYGSTLLWLCLILMFGMRTSLSTKNDRSLGDAAS